MPPETFEYSYHLNKKLKERKWLRYFDENKQNLKMESIRTFHENGLIVKAINKDYRKMIEYITEYKYKLR